MRNTVGLVTIGQSPRPDLLEDLRTMLPTGIRFLESGALDGYTTEQIRMLSPTNDRDVLVTRLRDGTEAVFGLSHIVSRFQVCVDKLNAGGADMIAFLCTATLPGVHSRVPIIRPRELVYGLLGSLTELGRIGILAPNERALKPLEEDFSSHEFDIVVSALSPYGKGSLEKCVSPFIDEDVSLIVMFCMGYNLSLKKKVMELTGKPAVLPQSLLAKAIEELSLG
jgi:protein AroM